MKQYEFHDTFFVYANNICLTKFMQRYNILFASELQKGGRKNDKAKRHYDEIQ